MLLRLIIILIAISTYGFACEVDPDLVQRTIDVAIQEGIQPELLIAVVWVESRFCPDAISPAGAIGLGQLMPATAEELNVNPKIPSQNLQGSSIYLSNQIERFKNIQLALAAYNAGAARVAKENNIPDIKETQKYIKLVMHTYLGLYDLNYLY